MTELEILEGIRREMEEIPGHLGFYYKNLVTGFEYGIREEEIYGAASVIKFPLFLHTLTECHKGPGGSVSEEKITYIYNGESVNYSSLEEWQKKENLDMMYPSILPYGVHIERILRQDQVDGTSTWVYVLNDTTFSIRINSYQSIITSNDSWIEYVTTSGLVFYVMHEKQAVHYSGKYEYIIQGNNFELLETVMEGMKYNEK